MSQSWGPRVLPDPTNPSRMLGTFYWITAVLQADGSEIPDWGTPCSTFWPEGVTDKTIWLRKSSAMIYGAQVDNGDMALVYVNDVDQPTETKLTKLVDCFGGQYRNSERHPDPGVPMLPDEGILFKMTSIDLRPFMDPASIDPYQSVGTKYARPLPNSSYGNLSIARQFACYFEYAYYL